MPSICTATPPHDQKTQLRKQCIAFGTGEQFVGPYAIFWVARYAARQLAGRRQLHSACSVVAD